MFRSAERTFKTGGGQTTALPNNLPTRVQNRRTMKVEIIAADPRHPSKELETGVSSYQARETQHLEPLCPSSGVAAAAALLPV